MVAAINKERARDSLPPLRSAPELARSAGAFAHYLLRNDSLAHRPSVSVSRAYPHCGEALAMHFSLGAQVRPTLRSWLGSPSHRGLVLTSSMNLVGIGHARGRLGRTWRRRSGCCRWRAAAPASRPAASAPWGADRAPRGARCPSAALRAPSSPSSRTSVLAVSATSPASRRIEATTSAGSSTPTPTMSPTVATA